MARLIIITTSELAPGFRLAGVTTLTACSAREASALVRELIDGGEKGVIGLHAPFWTDLDRDLRRRLETMVNPVVITLPAGSFVGGESERRAAIAAMLRRSIGYKITFPGEGEEDEQGPRVHRAAPTRE